MTGAPVRVLVVEDNEIYRSSLELLLGLREGLLVVGGVVDGAAAAAACVATRADVVVMDYRLPGLDGAAATAAVREASPHVAVVCLTAEATAEEQQKVLRAGAVALVEKSQPIEELAAAIRSAARREPVWS